jgi:predicted DNA-binding protein (MmcQ/YjbR family)
MLPRSEYIAVKCHPDRAIQLRDEFSAVTPAYHFNKKHWNDLLVTLLPPDVIKREIIHSYMLVILNNVTPKSLSMELLDIVDKAGIRDNAELIL